MIPITYHNCILKEKNYKFATIKLQNKREYQFELLSISSFKTVTCANQTVIVSDK